MLIRLGNHSSVYIINCKTRTILQDAELLFFFFGFVYTCFTVGL